MPLAKKTLGSVLEWHKHRLQLERLFAFYPAAILEQPTLYPARTKERTSVRAAPGA